MRFIRASIISTVTFTLKHDAMITDNVSMTVSQMQYIMKSDVSGKCYATCNAICLDNVILKHWFVSSYKTFVQREGNRCQQAKKALLKITSG